MLYAQVRRIPGTPFGRVRQIFDAFDAPPLGDPTRSFNVNIDSVSPRPQVGWIFDGRSRSFSAPNSPPSGYEPPRPELTPLQFWRRFTQPERVRLHRVLDGQDPNGVTITPAERAALWDFRWLTELGDSIPLNNPAVRQMIALMASTGIISGQRAQEIAG